MTYDDIRLEAKSDRELLIMLVDKLNHVCGKVDKHDRWLAGNGVPGIRTQVYIMWAVFIFLGSAIIKLWLA